MGLYMPTHKYIVKGQEEFTLNVDYNYNPGAMVLQVFKKCSSLHFPIVLKSPHYCFTFEKEPNVHYSLLKSDKIVSCVK